MFPKSTFGAATATPSFGFGATSAANPTPFGQSQLFGKTGTTPGFGTSAPLFGSTSQQPTGTLFSNSTVPSFGATPQAGFGLFGQQQTATGNNALFSNTSGTAFGQQNKTAGFGFGSTTATPLFGQQQSQPFQPSTSSNVFGAASGFGATQSQMGSVIKFVPVTGTDTMQKSGIAHSISTKHHCITCMKEYEAKSLEELRWEDYQCNRRGPQQQNTFGASPFGAPASTAPSLFGQTENKPAFGQTNTFGANNGFGLSNQTGQPSLFSKPMNAFASVPTSNAFGGFNTATSAFGTNTGVKAFGTQATPSVFGGATSQPSTFGTASTFFGQTSTPSSTNIFNKSLQTGFNTQQPSFFGQQPTAQNNLFQPSKTTSGFPSFGQTTLTSNTGFGQPSANLFTQNTPNPFNAFQKPAQPTFGQPLQTAFNTGAQQGGTNLFGNNKPLFGTTTQSSFFNPIGSGFMMPQQPQVAPNLMSSLEAQPQQDFHTLVEQLYEPFPYRHMFDGIETKKYSNSDVTNPVILKKIIEDAPLPITPSEDISKLRLKPRINSYNSSLNASKFALLTNTASPLSSQNNFTLKSTSGKRLVLKKGTPRTENDLLEEYKSISSPNAGRNNGLFKNGALEDSDKTPIDGFDISKMYSHQLSPNALLSPPQQNNHKPCESPQVEKSPNSAKHISTQTPQKNGVPNLNNSFTELDNGVFEANDCSLAKSLDASSMNHVDKSPVDTPKGIHDHSVKTVRFLEDGLEGNVMNDAVSPIYEANSIENDVNGNDLDNTVTHPCGIKLTRTEYYTIPPLTELPKYKTESGACIVKGFTVGRTGYGNVHFPEQVDLSNLDLDEIVHFGYRNVTIYPDDTMKPPVGQGLNRRAQVTLDKVWPRHRVTHEILRDPKDISAEQFLDRLVLLSEKQNAELVDYRPETGSWVFTVPHFSKYHFTDADDEEITKQLLKQQLQLQQQQLEQRKKDVESKTPEDRTPEVDENQIVSSRRGLGGTVMTDMFSSDMGELTFHQPLSHARLNSVFRDDSKSALLMKSSFFDEESISDDVSSTEIGIVHQFTFHSPLRVTLRSKPISHLPKSYTLLNSTFVAPLERSFLHSHNYMDMATFKGRSFKVGWGAGFTLVTTNSYSALQLCTENQQSAVGTVMLIKIGPLSAKPQMMYLEKHLQAVFKESTITTDSAGIPTAVANKSFGLLLNHQEITRAVENDHNMGLSYYREVWDLCFALWGPLAISPTNKRALFSKWLQSVALPHVQKDLERNQNAKVAKKIFAYLSGHELEQAVELALDHVPRLSILIAQAGCHDSTKMILHDQIQQWKDNGILEHINTDILKIYMLLGGIPTITGMNICEGLDWKRALAIHLWYICSPGTSLIHAIQLYEKAFSSLSYANIPSPSHYEYSKTAVHDVLYQIMQLFTTSTLSLQKIINPISYTSDPLDYRLSWLLLQFFVTFNVGTISEQAANALHVSFASQLENLGLWKWAIFVLLFIKDVSVKKNAIVSILDRNLNSNGTAEKINVEDSLVKDFKIPAKWIHAALANKTNLEDNFIEAYQHLLLKEDWHGAHEVAIGQIIPEFISTGQCEKLWDLLASLIPGRDKILSWDTQAGLVLDFLHLHDKITAKNETVTEFDLQTLTADLFGLCCRVKDFPATSLKQILAIAELSRFVAILLKIIYCELQEITHKTIQEATELITALVMPPDYVHDELIKYTVRFLNLDP